MTPAVLEGAQRALGRVLPGTVVSSSANGDVVNVDVPRSLGFSGQGVVNAARPILNRRLPEHRMVSIGSSGDNHRLVYERNIRAGGMGEVERAVLMGTPLRI